MKIGSRYRGIYFALHIPFVIAFISTRPYEVPLWMTGIATAAILTYATLAAWYLTESET